MKLKPADIILIRDSSMFGKAILWALRTFQKDPVMFYHIMMVEDDKYGIEAGTTISRFEIEKRLLKMEAYKIIRYKNFTDKERMKIINRAKKLMDRPYGVFRIVLQFLDQIFHTDFFTGLLKSKEIQVCSSLIAWAYYVQKRIKFNDVSWQSCEPDDIDDESIKNSDLWEIIFDSGGDKKCL